MASPSLCPCSTVSPSFSLPGIPSSSGLKLPGAGIIGDSEPCSYTLTFASSFTATNHHPSHPHGHFCHLQLNPLFTYTQRLPLLYPVPSSPSSDM